MDERSSSDDENYNNIASSPEEFDEVENIIETSVPFDRQRVDENLSNESDSEYSAGNQSDSDEKSFGGSNKSASINTSESENTTHSYSNSLLEDEEDDDDDDVDDDENNDADDSDVAYEDDDIVQSLPNTQQLHLTDLSDLNNGKKQTKMNIFFLFYNNMI